jgi:hypothetical protein
VNRVARNIREDNQATDENRRKDAKLEIRHLQRLLGDS